MKGGPEQVQSRSPTRGAAVDLFARHRFFTDDTGLTVATADALLTHGDSTGAQYPPARQPTATRFHATCDENWRIRCATAIREANCSAMPVSPVGWAFATLEETLAEAARSAAVNHNHPEGIKGAQATAAAIFLARTGTPKEDIRSETTDRFGYDLDRTIAEIRPTYRFDETCQGSVPEALVAYLDADDFAHTLRLAISLGGDADTQAAIAGAVAEAFWGGLPDAIEGEVRRCLLPDMTEVVDRARAQLGIRQPQTM